MRGAAIQYKDLAEILARTDSQCHRRLREVDAVLIFYDNIYMYGPPPLAIPFDENNSQIPTTQKGVIRKRVADMIMDAIGTNGLKAVIGRGADYYGPYVIHSLLYFSFLERMLLGKPPLCIVKPGVKHTYANTTDCGKALVALALDESTYGQVWHLPVNEPVTIEDVVAMFNSELGTKFAASFIPKPVQKILSLVNPPLREASEMLSQSDTEYVMSFDKFKRHFREFAVTPYSRGFREMIQSFQH